MPGKIEVSFKQWDHEVQCMKDHYPKSVVWESIMQSLKGAVADIARYMGPTTSEGHILQKLMVIFGTVVSFNILTWNFYKVMQNNHKEVPSFPSRLEGTLNEIRLQCPGRITNQKVQQYLKDHLFHGVHKHIRDSKQYFYSNPGTNYSQLMIAACKVESKNEEAHDKVRARSAMTTKPVEDTTELGNQIAKLVVALATAGQGNNPGSAPNSPRQRGCGRGWMDRNTPGHLSSHNGQTGLGQTTPPHSISPSHSTGTTCQGEGQIPKGPKIAKEALQIGRTPVPSITLGARVGATWLGNVLPQQRL